MSELPRKIGKYEIRALAGEGHMATVYVAYDPFEEREVAVKVCHILEDGNTDLRRRARKAFYNEAHAAWVLRHPNILQVYDTGEEDGEPFIVMEYVDGGTTLKSHTSSEDPLPVKSAVKILYKCAKALDYAHRKGIVHRDIKPTNVMLTREGEVKIADFGVAYSAHSSITQFMGLMGAPQYLSPEQVQEAEVTFKTDLYSLGVVAFELLTGQTPFGVSGVSELVQKIVKEPLPPLRRFRPDLPDRLEEILARAMEKTPALRHENGQELAADLAAVFGELDGGMPGEGGTSGDLRHTMKFEIATSLEFFQAFTNSELREMVQACRWESYPKGEVIVREGADDSALFILAEGRVDVSITGRPIASLGKGECFGEMNYLSDTGRTATVTAAEDVAVLRTDPETIGRTTISCQLRFNQVLTKVLLSRLAQTSDRLARSDRSAEAR